MMNRYMRAEMNTKRMMRMRKKTWRNETVGMVKVMIMRVVVMM